MLPFDACLFLFPVSCSHLVRSSCFLSAFPVIFVLQSFFNPI
jgi:hypothetical protein